MAQTSGESYRRKLHALGIQFEIIKETTHGKQTMMKFDYVPGNLGYGIDLINKKLNLERAEGLKDSREKAKGFESMRNATHENTMRILKGTIQR